MSEQLESAQVRRFDSFVLSEHFERLAHSFRMNQRFEAQPCFGLFVFACSGGIQIREVGLPSERQ